MDLAHAIFPVVCTSTGLSEVLTPGNTLVVYPNPSASGNFNFIVPQHNIKDNVLVRVYDMKGAVVFNQSIASNGNGIYQLSLPNADKGIYMLEVQTNNGVKTQRITVK